MATLSPIFERSRRYLIEPAFVSDPEFIAAPRAHVVMVDRELMDDKHAWLAEVKRACPDAAIIATVSSTSDVEVVSAKRLSVHGWVVWPRATPEDWDSGIEAALARRAAEDVLRKDPLTGLPNREVFTERLERAILRAERTAHLCAVIMIDLNGLKTVNDRHGHDVGDAFIVGVARHMASMVRDNEVIARLGGDEFAVLLEDLNDASGIRPALERLHRASGLLLEIGDNTFRPSAAFGHALYGDNGETAEELLRWADQKMLDQKASGTAFPLLPAKSRHDTTSWHLRRIEELKDKGHVAIKDYARVNVHDGKTAAVGFRLSVQSGSVQFETGNALLEGEDGGQKQRLFGWLLAEAAKEDRNGIARVLVDAPSRHFWDERYLDQLEALRAAGVTHIELQVPLDGASASRTQLVRGITACRDRGIDVALRDFGRDLECVGWLADCGAHAVVIEEEVVSGIDKRGRSDMAARLALEFAKNCGATTVAAGVRRDSQLELLLNWGCDFAQGPICDVLAVKTGEWDLRTL